MLQWIRSRASQCAVIIALVAAAFALRAFCSDYAQGGPADGIPDVIVGDIHDAQSYGSQNDVAAFSIGTTSCNIGTKALDWFPEPNPNHPVIAQNLYRVKEGRIEQIGLSWLKHGFYALNEDLCGTCQGTPGNRLGVNCSDPYSAGLNGSQGNLGPRSQVNVATGKYVLPFRRPVPPTNKLAGRLQVKKSDLDAAQNMGAVYFAEAQYVHPQDAQAGNGANNASYRPVTFPAQAGEFTLTLDPAKPTVRQSPGIAAWKAQHGDVRLFNVDVPNDGRLILGIRSIASTGGGFHHEIALQNLTSDRSAQAITVETESGAVKNPGFHGVTYFGEQYSSDDWTATSNGPAIGWAAGAFADNENANALRWGTLYSFWFDSDKPATRAVIQLFKPGGAGDPKQMTIALGGGPELVAQRMPKGPSWLAEGQRADREVRAAETFRLVCGKDIDRELEDVSSSHPLVRATATRAAEKDKEGRVYWNVVVEPNPKAKAGYFETILTFKTKSPGDHAVSIRAYGDVPPQ